MKNIISLFVLLSWANLNVIAQYDYPFRNPALPQEERINDLISRLTLEEKAGQLMNDAAAIERLGIPPYNWWNECLHGVARAGNATVFPQAIGLAATWDTALIYQVSTAISDEARAKHHFYKRNGSYARYQGLTFWSPNINIFRDPRWGRGMETYGEDPFLTGSIGVQFIKGLQGNDPKYLKLVATSKHYVVHSGPEPDRHSFNAVTSRRDLLETYLPAFAMTVRDANVQSVMCAYNRTNGEVCCGSDYLLTKLLKDTLGFDGYIVSDCGAIRDFYRGHNIVKTGPEAAAIGVRSGTDLNCGNIYSGLLEAVRLGLITEDEIDISLRRLMKARFILGMFDPEEMVPYSKIPLSVVENQEHVKLAEITARESMVLLKNENNLLPLSKNLKTLAVIGPNANDIEVLYGNYNGFSKNPITPLEGIRKKIPGTKVKYSRGCDIAENIYSLDVIPPEMFFTTEDSNENGVKGEYFNNGNIEGQPELTRIDNSIEFNWWDGVPVEGFIDDNFSIRWSGFLKAPVTGEYIIGCDGPHKARIEFNRKKIAEFDRYDSPAKVSVRVMLQKGKRYPLTIEFTDTKGMASINMLWKVPGKDLEKEAIRVARKADAVIMCMGLSPRIEGEEMKVEVKGFSGGDRISLGLPEIQQDLIKKIYSLGKPVVLVLINGSAVSVNWGKENIPAILEAWYPGQAAGTAIADILFGDYNPSGRLPVTFYKSEKDLPDFKDYNMEGKTYRYFRKEPLFEFGYGLSYTTFTYSNFKLPKEACIGDHVKLSVDVTNKGTVDGDEIVQLYLAVNNAPVPVPIRSLKGFTKVFLKAGETKTVEMYLNPEDFSIVDERGIRKFIPGSYTMSIGGRQPGREAVELKSVLISEIELKQN